MKKLLALLLVLLMVLTVVGCGSDNSTSTPQSGDNFEGNVTKAGIYTIEKDATFTADKNLGERYWETISAGIIYKENGKFGILSFNGYSDSGASYTHFKICYSNSDSYTRYYEVSKAPKRTAVTVDTVNVYGLMDGNGKVILEDKYAIIDVLNDRFAQVYIAEAETDKKEAALLYASVDYVSTYDDSDRTPFLGKTFVIDLYTGSTVPNTTFTAGNYFKAYGNFVYLNQEYIRSNGEKLSSNEFQACHNGSYSTKSNGVWTVFSSAGKELFKYDHKEKVLAYAEYNRYVMYDREADKYYIADEKGQKISGEFDTTPDLRAENIYVYDHGYCTMDGTVLLMGAGNGGKYNQFGSFVFISSNKGYVYLESGKKLEINKGDAKQDDGIGNLYKTTDAGNAFYCVKDNDYTINGKYVGPWLIETEDGKLVESYSNATVLEGYKSYRFQQVALDSGVILAQKEDNTYDVFYLK